MEFSIYVVFLLQAPPTIRFLTHVDYHQLMSGTAQACIQNLSARFAGFCMRVPTITGFQRTSSILADCGASDFGAIFRDDEGYSNDFWSSCIWVIMSV